MLLETNELVRHYEMLDRLPRNRVCSEWVLRVANESPDTPTSMESEAVLESHTIDTILPILMQRARGLGQVATIDTMMAIQQLKGELAAPTPPTIGRNG